MDKPIISIQRMQMLNETTGKWSTSGKFEVVKYESNRGNIRKFSLGFYTNLKAAKEAASIARQTAKE